MSQLYYSLRFFYKNKNSRDEIINLKSHLQGRVAIALGMREHIAKLLFSLSLIPILSGATRMKLPPNGRIASIPKLLFSHCDSRLMLPKIKQ